MYVCQMLAKRIVLIGIFIFSAARSQSFQSFFSLKEIETQYPFIQLQENKIITFRENTLTYFLERLHDVQFSQKQQVHIFHLGDSHIQADIFTGQVRRRFQEDEKFGISSRGFLFPYKLAQSNNPFTFNVAMRGVWQGFRCVKSTHFSRWGVAGVTALTYDLFATFTVNPNPQELLYPIHKIKIFYPVENPTSYVPEIYPEAGNRVINEQIGNGYIEFTLAKTQSRITVGLRKTNPIQNHFLLQGISLENYYAGVVYSASGANGAEYRHYIRCEDFSRNLQALEPHLVVISLGTNDGYMLNFDRQYFEANVRYIINKIRNQLPNISILLTTPGDNFRRYRYPNKNNAIISEVLYQVAQEMDCALWDFYKIMGGFRSVEKWYAYGLCTKDMLHLTAKGYTLQGNLFFEALRQAYLDYLKEKHEKQNVSQTSGN
ncbi:MAG: GDSL-type esterase/lipase family protein [Cytophagales bacterium]|nr:GDSL-type esterase/lipase family protein [Cytophagales bacterium]MDW8384989.1 GDSL-type esterase/lipase family protein [Flammeovirgaceae bacterium]